MIVFTIAYGEDYIKRFFNRCLVSLATPANLPAVADQNLELCVLTLKSDIPMVRDYLASPLVKQLFGDRVAMIAQSERIDPAVQHLVSVSQARMLNFMIQIITRCLKKGRPFLYAATDLLYADGSVKNAYALHRLTGKTVAMFNGRVGRATGPIEDAELLSLLKKPHALQEFFFANLNSDWQACRTSDVDTIPGTTQGNLIYEGEGQRYVFCDGPNPVLGMFTHDDLLSFARGRGLQSWDLEWGAQLNAAQRLVILTDLNQGMSIEPENDPPFATSGEPSALLRDSLPALGTMSLDTIRRYKFSGRYANFCFTALRS